MSCEIGIHVAPDLPLAAVYLRMSAKHLVLGILLTVQLALLMHIVSVAEADSPRLGHRSTCSLSPEEEQLPRGSNGAPCSESLCATPVGVAVPKCWGTLKTRNWTQLTALAQVHARSRKRRAAISDFGSVSSCKGNRTRRTSFPQHWMLVMIHVL